MPGETFISNPLPRELWRRINSMGKLNPMIVIILIVLFVTVAHKTGAMGYGPAPIIPDPYRTQYASSPYEIGISPWDPWPEYPVTPDPFRRTMNPVLSPIMVPYPNLHMSSVSVPYPVLLRIPRPYVPRGPMPRIRSSPYVPELSPQNPVPIRPQAVSISPFESPPLRPRSSNPVGPNFP